MASWLLVEEDEASGSRFFGRMGTAIGDIGRSFKKGIKDIVSSTWGVLGTIFTTENKKAQERYRAAKRRSERFAAEYREAENRINSILSEPGARMFLSAILPTGAVSTDLILRNAYKEITSFGSGMSLADRLDAWSARWGENLSAAAAGGAAGSTLIKDLKKLFYGEELGEVRSNQSNILFEQAEEQKAELKKRLMQDLKSAFDNLGDFLMSALESLEAIEQNITNYDAVVNAKKKAGKDESDPKEFEEVQKTQQGFIEGLLREFQKDFLDPLKKEFPWLSTELDKIKLDNSQASIRKDKEILQNALKRISN